ncbi:MAG: lysophospholipid acyltransferase family protein [Candidatus Omnitrophica bacterium]|nr:lysophospholipid acyltransferase family protein [Candidatus Omnitrophota bacterium]
MKKKWYRPVLYQIACIMLRLLHILPRLWVLLFARGMGKTAFLVLREEQKKTIAHLSYAFGTVKSRAELIKIAKCVFENLALTACDFALFPKLTAKTINNLVSVVNIEIIDNVVKKNRQGAIILTAHLGNWELLAATLMVRGYKGFVLAKEINYPGYNDIITQLRESQGVYSCYRGRFFREILKRLKAGESVGVLPDQDISDVEGIFINFFGKPAYTPTGPARLAFAAHVPIVVAFMIREHNAYRLIIDRSIEPIVFEGENKTSAVERITREWSQVVEQYIMQYPEQWAWMHNRWKTKEKTVRNGE